MKKKDLKIGDRVVHQTPISTHRGTVVHLLEHDDDGPEEVNVDVDGMGIRTLYVEFLKKEPGE